jgi:hypothetical protein
MRIVNVAFIIAVLVVKEMKMELGVLNKKLLGYTDIVLAVARERNGIMKNRLK